MKAYVYHEYGDVDVESFAELPVPEPGPDELLVVMVAAGVNPADWKIRRGDGRAMFPTEFPAVIGREAAGTVEAVGDGVGDFAVGDAVFGHPPRGAFAEYVVVPAAAAGRKPAGLSFADAATIPVAAATAYDGVGQLELGTGDTVLITGVGGGVGIAAAQIAIARGTRVIGTASASKRDFVEALGVTHVEYGPGETDRLRAAAPDGVDAVYDMVGGDALRTAAGLARDPARLISAGDGALGVELGGQPHFRARTVEVLDACAAMMVEGTLKPFVTRMFPLDQADQAMRAVEDGHTRGKVVIQARAE